MSNRPINRTLIFLALGVFFTGAVHAQTALSLISSFDEPVTTPDGDGVLDLVYKELGRRLNITITVDRLKASERVLLNANSGVDDGIVGGVPGLEKIYPKLIRIPVPIYHYEMVVLSSGVDFKVAGKESIIPYDIGIVRGWKILEKIAVGAHSVTSVDEIEDLLGMLEKKRIEIALFEKSQALFIIKKMGLKEIKILQPNLLEGDWYLYLNNKHKDLIPKITAELLKMYKDGTIKDINVKVRQKYGY